jgi:hypothetical protein
VGERTVRSARRGSIGLAPEMLQRPSPGEAPRRLSSASLEAVRELL